MNDMVSMRKMRLGSGDGGAALLELEAGDFVLEGKGVV
jgi:hypothetical protein